MLNILILETSEQASNLGLENFIGTMGQKADFARPVKSQALAKAWVQKMQKNPFYSEVQWYVFPELNFKGEFLGYGAGSL